MRRIRCFLLEPSGNVSIKLRRYKSPHQLEGSECPLDPSKWGYHDASAAFCQEPEKLNEEGSIANTLDPVPAHDDPRWPRQCACGYTFSEKDAWQPFVERLYRRKDTGEEMTLANAPAGAMWYDEWCDRLFVPQREHCLVVKTPGGEWTVDGQARNCGLPEDRRQEKHHCWILHGEVPDVTVDKDGTTCTAGAGSIQCGTYHGFLRNGYLED